MKPETSATPILVSAKILFQVLFEALNPTVSMPHQHQAHKERRGSEVLKKNYKIWFTNLVKEIK